MIKLYPEFSTNFYQVQNATQVIKWLVRKYKQVRKLINWTSQMAVVNFKT